MPGAKRQRDDSPRKLKSGDFLGNYEERARNFRENWGLPDDPKRKKRLQQAGWQQKGGQ